MLEAHNSVAHGMRAGHSCTPCPHRLAVKTSWCGRDDPGSTPGEDMSILLACAPLQVCTGQDVGTGRYGSLHLAVGRCGSLLLAAVRLAPIIGSQWLAMVRCCGSLWFAAGQRATARRHELQSINHKESARATARQSEPLRPARSHRTTTSCRNPERTTLARNEQQRATAKRI